MRLLAFFLRTNSRQYVTGAIYAGGGFRCDIGPVRFDIGQMQAPWAAVLFRLGDEVHRAACHVGRLGMLIRDAGGLVGMDEERAVLQRSVFGRAGIGPVLPGILGVVSVLAQVGIVSRARPIARMQAVVALIGLKTAFRHM